MKVGDLIKPTDYGTPSFGLGIVVVVDNVAIAAINFEYSSRRYVYLIQWSNGRQSWQTPRQIEVINESR